MLPGELRLRIVVALVAAAAFALSACGGPIRQDELRRSVESLQSYAAEGTLIANDAAQDRTKATFTRVRCGELAERAEHEAEKLNDAAAKQGTAEAKPRAVSIASEISDQLSRLQVAPSDPAVARDVQRHLADLADDAERLADTL
jgi:hypothetical protein